MKKKTLKVAFRELCAEVKTLTSNEALSLVERFNQAMPLVSQFLSSLRQEKLALGFADQLDEIYFFKFEKPEFYSQKIFLAGWFTLSMGRPSGTDQMLREYYHTELAQVDRFFRQNAFHYQYYRSGFTELDELLFVRGMEVSLVHLPEVPELDAEFATAGDYLFAKFMAYEQLQEFILSELKNLDQRNVAAGVGISGSAKKWFDWTGEVINLVELGYAVWLSGQLNAGKAGLQEIFRWLEECFGVEIGIPANRFREIKRRKRLSRTHYMDLCRSSLLDYMDEDDAFHPG